MNLYPRAEDCHSCGYGGDPTSAFVVDPTASVAARELEVPHNWGGIHPVS